MRLRQLMICLLLFLSAPAMAFDWLWLWRPGDSKYEVGDCITPTDQSMSFYGHYARVEGVINFDGVGEPGVYSLYFPVYVARTPLHAQTLDERTQQVDNDFCEPQQVTQG